MSTNWTKGELSRQIEGRPDLAAFFNGASILENFWIFYEGGVFRRYGTGFINETKNSSKKAILLPFKFNIEQAYFIEAGEGYFRFYRRGLNGNNRLQRIEDPPGTPVEVATPYGENDLADLQWRESADVLFIVHPNYQQRKLSRISDTAWAITVHAPDPPPSFEADEDIALTSGLGSSIYGAPAAITGTTKWRVGQDVFLAGDVGRQIIYAAGRATITALDSARQVSINILDVFQNNITPMANTLSSTGTAVTQTDHDASVNDFIVLTSGAQAGEIRQIVSVADQDNYTIDAAFSAGQSGQTANLIIGAQPGEWFLRGSPQATLDPDKKTAGATVALVAGANTFRSGYASMFVKVYGGVIKLTAYNSPTSMTGKIITELADATSDNPAAAPAGSWTLEETSWSDARGWPSTIEFHQGRLVYGGNRSQPTTVWFSATDSFDNFAIGVTASDGLEYTLADGEVNVTEWIQSSRHLFIGDAEQEHSMRGPGVDSPIGGDQIPFVSHDGDEGALSTMAITVQKMILFIHAFARKVVGMAYDLQDDAFSGNNLTTHSRHIAGANGFRQHPPVLHKEPNYLIHFPREDGQVASLTALRKEQVLGWSRMVSPGAAGQIEAMAVNPDKYHKQSDLAFIAKRTINGQVKRLVEVLITPEDSSTALANRLWREYHTDCGVDGVVSAGATTIPVPHLEGESVDVIIGDSFRESLTVSGGQVVLSEPVELDSTYEIGLHYKSTLRTMRPAIPGGTPIEGLIKSWKHVFLLILDSIGGKLNGRDLLYPPSTLSGNQLRNGLIRAEAEDSDLDGYLTIEQDQPYPLQILSLTGTLHVGDD